MIGLHQPELRAFLASLDPDPALLDLGRALEAVDGQYRRLLARGGEIRERLSALDLALIDATDKARAQLLAERAPLDAERASLPAQLAEVARRHTLAHLAYLRRAAQLARAEALRCRDALDPPIADCTAALKKIERIEGARGTEGGAFADERVAELRREHAALVAGMRPLTERKEQARLALSIAEGLAVQIYGDDARLDREYRWADVAEMVARRAARHLQVA